MENNFLLSMIISSSSIAWLTIKHCQLCVICDGQIDQVVIVVDPDMQDGLEFHLAGLTTRVPLVLQGHLTCHPYFITQDTLYLSDT